MKNGWQCPRCHEKWEDGQEQPCNHDVSLVKLSYMDPAEMIAQYGAPTKPLRKMTHIADNGKFTHQNGYRRRIHAESNTKGEKSP